MVRELHPTRIAKRVATGNAMTFTLAEKPSCVVITRSLQVLDAVLQQRLITLTGAHAIARATTLRRGECVALGEVATVMPGLPLVIRPEEARRWTHGAPSHLAILVPPARIASHSSHGAV